MSSPGKRSYGHVYEFVDWQGEELLKNGDYIITITLKDKTAAKLIKLSGIARLLGDFGSMWLDNLEGYKQVLINVSGRNKPAKVRKYKSGDNVSYKLEDV